MKERIVRATEIAVTVAAYIAGVVLVLLMLLTSADVAGRYFLNSPITGVFDLTHFAVLTMTFLGLAYCCFHDGHVAIELFYDKMNHRTKLVLDRLTNLAGCILFLVIAWQSVVQSVLVRQLNETSQLIEIPFFPFYWLLAFGSILFAFVMGLKIFVDLPGNEDRT